MQCNTLPLEEIPHHLKCSLVVEITTLVISVLPQYYGIGLH